jgi:hypothetical protein
MCDLTRRLASLARNWFQAGRGYIVTKIYIGGPRHKLAFLRRPQARLLNVATLLRKARAG